MATRVHLNDQLMLRVAPMVRYLPRTRLPAMPQRTQSTLPASLQSEKPPITRLESCLEVRREGLTTAAPRSHTKGRLRTQAGIRVVSGSSNSSPERKRHLPESVKASNSFLCSPADVPASTEVSLSPLKPPKSSYCGLRCHGKKIATAVAEDKREVHLVPFTFRECLDNAPGAFKWEETARVGWRRRAAFRSYPLLILNFEGVLGDFMRFAPWTAAQDFHFRPGFEKSLPDLLAKFQVVLMTALSKQQRTALLDLLERRFGIIFDAVYKKRKVKGSAFVLDYSQVLLDFSLDSGLENVLIVTSVGLDQEDLAEREGSALIEDASTSLHRRFQCHAAPSVPLHMLSPPITLLVPNPRAQPNYSCVGFDSIAKVIGELAHVDDDHSAHFCSSYANLESTAGLKKAGVPARLLSNHRNAGLRQEKSADRDDHEWWFLVLCGSRFPQTTYRVLADSGKSPRRYIDRKVSTKSVF